MTSSILGGGLVGLTLAYRARRARAAPAAIVDPADPATVLAAGLRRAGLRRRQRLVPQDAGGDRRGSSATCRARVCPIRAIQRERTGSAPGGLSPSIPIRTDGPLGIMFENRHAARARCTPRGRGGSRTGPSLNMLTRAVDDGAGRERRPHRPWPTGAECWRRRCWSPRRDAQSPTRDRGGDQRVARWRYRSCRDDRHA